MTVVPLTSMNLIGLLVSYSYITWIGIHMEQLRQSRIFGVLNRKQERTLSGGYGYGCTLQLLRRPWRVSRICVELRYSMFSNILTGQSLISRSAKK